MEGDASIPSSSAGAIALSDDTLTGSLEGDRSSRSDSFEIVNPLRASHTTPTTSDPVLTYASSFDISFMGGMDDPTSDYDPNAFADVVEEALKRRPSAELQPGIRIPNTIPETSENGSIRSDPLAQRVRRSDSSDIEADFTQRNAHSQSSVSSLMFYSSKGGAVLTTQTEKSLENKPSLQQLSLDTNQHTLPCNYEQSPRTPWSGEDFVHFSKSIYYKIILPLCVLFYTGTGAVICVSLAMQWRYNAVIVYTVAALQLVLSTGVLIVAFFYIYRHWDSPLIASRGKVHIIQVLLSMTLHKPILFVQTLIYAGLIHSGDMMWAALVLSGRMCMMVWVSAIVARQRQIVQVFHISLFRQVPPYTYRNTVLGICTLYIIALAISLGLLFAGVDDFSIAFLVADFISFGILSVFIYQSRDVSARFTDYYSSIRWVVLMLVSYACVIAQKLAPFGDVYNTQGDLIANWTGVLTVVTVLLSTTVIILDTFVPLIYVVENKLDPELNHETYSTRKRSNSTESQFNRRIGSENRTGVNESEDIQSSHDIEPINITTRGFRSESLGSVRRLASRSTSSAICVVATVMPTIATANASESQTEEKKGKAKKGKGKGADKNG